MKSFEKAKEGFEVFEFKAEDEDIESTAGRFTGKFKNPNTELDDRSPLTKYTFLQTFARGPSGEITEIRDTTCIDVDDTCSDDNCNNYGSDALHTSTEDCAVTEVILDPEANPVPSSIDYREDTQTNEHPTEPKLSPGCSIINEHAAGSADAEIGIPLAFESLCLGGPSSEEDQLNCNNTDLPSNKDQVDVISDDDESVNHSSDIEEDRGFSEGSSSDHCSSGWEMDNVDDTVVLYPDYLVYGDGYSTESSLRFCCSCITLEGTYAYGSKESFSNKWGIDEVIDIVSLWYARIETAMVKIHLRQMVDGGAENPDGSSGILELKFSVVDPSWFENREKIVSMEARYSAVWRDLRHSDEGAVAFVGTRRRSSSKGYYPNFSEPFEDVIYPKGDPDAVSISKRDVELLQPETFINDTIIDFYIKYLKNKIEPQERHRFHFFNSFFFRKLADMDKNPASASEGRAAFLRVRKWTRKVNLFEKDFVFIPVNFNLHWSLLIVCHPGEVAVSKDEDIDKALKVPCILHMDSIKGSHRGLKNLVQSYLWEEWRERNEELSEDVSSKFFNLRFVSLEVPQQENSFDCGLFLLHYVERFLEEAPLNFSPFTITKFSDFLNMDWFPPAEASLKRSLIQNLIHELLKHDTQKSQPANENEQGVEFNLERQGTPKACHGYSACSSAGQGIEIKLLTAQSSGSQLVSDSGRVLRELMETGSASGSLPNVSSLEQIMPLHRFKSSMSPVKEDGESGEHLAFSSSGGALSLSPTGISDNAFENSYVQEGVQLFEAINSGKPLQQDGHYSDSSVVETSSLGTQSSTEERDEELLSHEDYVSQNELEEAEGPRSASPEDVECILGSPVSDCSDRLETRIVEDSQEVDTVVENDENRESNSGENGNHLSGHVELSGDDSLSERATKRLKIMHEAERQYASSITKDCHS